MNNASEAWSIIAARIEGLEEALLGFTRIDAFLLVGRNPADVARDAYSILASMFIPSLKEIFQAIQSFRDTYRKELSTLALACIERFEVAAKKAIGEQATAGSQQAQIILAFSSLRSELNYYLSGTEIKMKKLVERAFSHLRRSIVVDSDFQAKWKAAYAAGETACEKQGSIHLLSHGIWAFKANSPEEKTDLVLASPIDELEVKQTASALILTEWKKAPSKATADSVRKLIEGAITQAKIYSGSILAGFEVRSTRYIPIVSDDRVSVDDHEEGGILYRVINIPVNPSTPSNAPAA